MGEVIERKCKQCKETIVIDADNIQGVALYSKSYYHTDCLRSNAEQKVTAKRGKWQAWATALEQIEKYEQEAYHSIRAFAVRNELNKYILDNYDVVAVPSRFWQVLADLENGKYRQKTCRPVSTEDVLGAWKWGQNKLDKIALNNQINKRGPDADEGRIMYDLSIVVQHVGDYRRHKKHIELQAAAAKIDLEKDKAQTSVNYEVICKNKENNRQHDEDNINDLIDEIFG